MYVPPAGTGHSARWLPPLLMVLLATSLLREISEPFWGLHDFNSADQAQFARILLRQPLSITHGLPTYALGDEAPAQPHHYAHHPPLITWLTAGLIALFGDFEWAVRLAPILCSLVGMACWMRTVRENRGAAAAVATGLLYAILPVGVFFGRMTNHEAPTLCFSLVALWGWSGLAARCGNGGARRLALGLGTSLAIYSGWPGTIVAGLIAADAIRLRAARRIPRSVALLAVLAPAAVFVVLLAHLVTGGLDGRWDAVLALIGSRAGGAPPPKSGDDPFSSYLDYTVQNFSWPVLALALLGIAAAVTPLRLNGVRPTDWFPAAWIMLIAGLLHLGFVRQALRHHYWWFYLWPTVAYFAAEGLLCLSRLIGRRSPRAARVAAMAVAAIAFVSCAIRTNRYFSYQTYPPNQVAFWLELRDLIGPRTPIALGEPMISRERHGSYVHWWWASPVTAYYMDRPFEPALTATELRAASQRCRYFVIAHESLQRRPDVAAALSNVAPIYSRWGFDVFETALMR